MNSFAGTKWIKKEFKLSKYKDVDGITTQSFKFSQFRVYAFSYDLPKLNWTRLSPNENPILLKTNIKI